VNRNRGNLERSITEKRGSKQSCGRTACHHQKGKEEEPHCPEEKKGLPDLRRIVPQGKRGAVSGGRKKKIYFLLFTAPRKA